MHIKVEGDLLAGQIYVSGPGRLPCKAIIHAVGPMWRGGTNEEDKILSEAVRKSLDEASKRRYHSIAIPAISSAIFGYPVDMATSVIVETIYSYLEGDMSSTLKEVYLLDMDDAAVNCFERIMRDIGAGHNRSGERQTSAPMRRHASARSLNSPNEDDGMFCISNSVFKIYSYKFLETAQMSLHVMKSAVFFILLPYN